MKHLFLSVAAVIAGAFALHAGRRVAIRYCRYGIQDRKEDPLFAFGHGLGYTGFEVVKARLRLI